MQMSMIARRLAVFTACALAAAGCNRGERDAAGPAKMDTTNAQWEDGLSSQQVQDSARALSPEEAAQMGLSVDTTIHLEQLDGRDTLPGGGAAPTPAPSAGGSGATDAVGTGTQPVPQPATGPGAPTPPAAPAAGTP
ncbi:MAG TPA: hypothetical protein VLK84_10140 [Longimicrobium sp.]|nr:hypothetical protein [Longimicrobium sp.]